MNVGLRRVFRSSYLASVIRAARSVYYSTIFFNRYYRNRVGRILPTTLRSRELSNFTYDLTSRNLNDLAHIIAVVTGKTVAAIRSYIAEARGDTELKAALEESLRQHHILPIAAVESPFGRRLGWYAFVRALKPKVVVETGVDRGHGALILCAALLRNAAEGKPGRYYGTDIDPRAGWLLTGKYAEVGILLYGDSIESLKTLDQTIDLFINDSDHSVEYEYREYQTIKSKLASNAVLLGDNSHTNDRLACFSEETGRRFLFFREEPDAHWYPGAGIGISYMGDTAPNMKA